MAGKLWKAVGYVPVTILVIAGASGWLAVNGYYGAESGAVSLLSVLNPVYVVGSLLTHLNWSHYSGNMILMIPVGVVLTYLTSNRHVLGVVLVSHVLAIFLLIFTLHQPVIGASIGVFALLAATLIRGTDIAAQRSSSRTAQLLFLCLMLPFVLGILYLGVVDTGSDISHFGHLFGFVLGGAYEAIHIFSERERERAAAGTDRSPQAPWQG